MPDMEKVIQELNDSLKNLHCGFVDGIGNVYAVSDETIKNIIALLKEQEAVDKNTGQWKNGHCSCCGEDISSMLDTWTNIQNFLFCPNCGAKMEE